MKPQVKLQKSPFHGLLGDKIMLLHFQNFHIVGTVKVAVNSKYTHSTG